MVDWPTPIPSRATTRSPRPCSAPCCPISVLFYTDGLIEDRHRDITDGLDALAVAMRSSAAVSAEQTCVAAQAMLPGSVPRADDVCLLAARLTG